MNWPKYPGGEHSGLCAATCLSHARVCVYTRLYLVYVCGCLCVCVCVLGIALAQVLSAVRWDELLKLMCC